MKNALSKNTRIIQDKLEKNSFSAVVEPMVLSTTFLRNENGVYNPNADIYTRASNPNRKLLESKLAMLESGLDAFCFSSGQAATMAIFSALGANSHLILPDDIYYGTRVLANNVFSNFNVSSSIVDMTSLEAIENAIIPETKLIWIETPSNPQLKMVDIEKIVELAKKKNILTACDNTWATPFFTTPFDFGVDLIMHSSTKYLGGHSDILGGVVISSENTNIDLVKKIKEIQHLGGAVPSPFDCWLLHRSLGTFFVRMPVHGHNAMQLAEFLDKHPKVEKVFYPGLPTDEYHQLAKKQMKNGFGGMLSILIKGDEANCLKIASKLKVFKHATSLGGIESLVDHRFTAEGTHSTSPPNLLRISVGIENITDLINDFKQALS